MCVSFCACHKFIRNIKKIKTYIFLTLYQSYNSVYNLIYYLHRFKWLGDGSFLGKNARREVELFYETNRKKAHV